MSQTSGWTEERRRRQSDLIHTWKPWQNATGPRTPEGKMKVSRNSYKGGARPMLRELARAMREQAKLLSDVQP